MGVEEEYDEEYDDYPNDHVLVVNEDNNKEIGSCSV